MTGIIDRLERGGWITRERDPHDRRAVVVQVVRSRGQELLRMFAGMNAALTEICADYTDAELAVIARFLNQTADAGRAAAEELPTSPLPDPLVHSRHLGAAGTVTPPIGNHGRQRQVNDLHRPAVPRGTRGPARPPSPMERRAASARSAANRPPAASPASQGDRGFQIPASGITPISG